MVTGPPKKPTALKVLQGNPGKRALPKNEPKPRRVRLKCPSWMGTEGRREWNRAVRELQQLGLVTVVDQGALEMLCKAYQEWRKADEWIDEHGSVYPIRGDKIDPKTGKGEVKYIAQVPQVSIARNAAELYRKLCAEFGMTPAARARLGETGNQRQVAADAIEAYFA